MLGHNVRSICYDKTITCLSFKTRASFHFALTYFKINMEAIILKLLVPDGDVIKQGTQELTNFMKTPEGIPQLCNCLATSQNVQVRQYASLLLRKRFGKRKAWMKLPINDRQVVKQGCLQALTTEPEKSVRHAIGQLVAVLAKHELSKSKDWPELFSFLETCYTQGNVEHFQLGIYCISALSETAGSNLVKGKLRIVAPYVIKALSAECGDLDSSYYAVQAVTHLVTHVGSEQTSDFRPFLQHAIETIKRLISAASSGVCNAEDKACEAMDLFDELFESEHAALVGTYVKPIVELCIAAAATSSLDDAVRVKAITFLGRITKLKKKAMIKTKLYINMIDCLFPILCAPSNELDGDDSDDEDDPENPESKTPPSAASQALDVLALNLPPDKFMTALLKHVEPALQSNDPGQLKAAYYALAVTAEGCSEHIRNKVGLDKFLQAIGNGIRDENHPQARNAALYALGQFSEYLQPEISEYAGQILPVLFSYLDSTMAAVHSQGDQGKDPAGLDRIFYALEVFSENLEEKLAPFLDELMKRLLPMMSVSNDGSTTSIHVRELAISGVGSAANAVGSKILPYFDTVMTNLKHYLSLDYQEEENQLLLTQSMDTLGAMARAIGGQDVQGNPAILASLTFSPAVLAEECCKLALDLVTKYDDPDIRKCAYGLFGSVAYVAKAEMAAVLPTIIARILESVTSKEGISLEYKEEEIKALGGALALDELNGDDEEDEEDFVSLENGEMVKADEDDADLDGVDAIRVENAFMQEKEQALLSLKDICRYVGPAAYSPYLNQSILEAWNLLEYPDEDVRKAAVQAVGVFMMAYYKLAISGAGFAADSEFQGYILQFVPKVSQMIKEDDFVSVVCGCLDTLADVLKNCKNGVTSQPGIPEKIVECVQRVMRSDCACMDNEDVGEESEEVQEAEQDELLFEYAGEILPSLGLAMTAGMDNSNGVNNFAPYFAGIFPMLLKKTKQHCTVAERSFTLGSFAECMKPLGSGGGNALQPFIQHLLPVYTKSFKDEDKDVRNNAIYGIGELALHGGAPVHNHFPAILQSLSSQLAVEKDPRCLDQIVGAVCRLIISNKTGVPIEQVLPVVFANLPLREDMEEYEPVLRALHLLYTDGNEMVKTAMPKLLEIFASIYDKKVPQDQDVFAEEDVPMVKVKPMIESLVKLYKSQFVAQYSEIVAMLQSNNNSDLAANLERISASSN